MTKLLKLPGLIDIHTHLRSPGQTHKEDFYTGTMAAINGGFTTIIDMPNNLIPVTTNKILTEKIEIAKEEIISDLGFHFGSLGDNFEEFPKVKSKVFGLKLYLNHTTGNFIIGKKELEIIYSKWDSHQPILLHAEDDVLDMVFEIIKKTNKKTHICHVSSEIELSKIIKAKERGLPVSCGVTAHHLFLTEDDEKRLGVFGRMKPFLKSKRDVQFLWKHLSYVDIIESDHAPHTIKEKESDAPFGVPGLDTTLPLLVTAFKKGKLTLGDITRLCYTNPAKIFNIKKDSTTYIEVLLEQYKIKKENLKTKCGWSPFDGMDVVGKVSKVVIRGEKVMSGGKIIAKKGSGKIIYPD